MVGVCGTGKHGETHRYYLCKNARKKNGCEGTSIPADKLEQKIIQYIKSNLLTDEKIETIVKSAADYRKKELEDDSKLNIFTNQLKDVDKKIKNLVKAIENGIEIEDMKTRITELQEQKKRTAPQYFSGAAQ